MPTGRPMPCEGNWVDGVRIIHRITMLSYSLRKLLLNPILGDVWHVRWLGGGVGKFTYPYYLLKYFFKLHQTWQFCSTPDKDQKNIHDILIFVMTSSHFIDDVIKISVWRSTGKSVYLSRFLSGEVGYRINNIRRSMLLIPGIIPGNIPGNNTKNDICRHNDVTWSDFDEKFRKTFFQ